MHVQGQVCWGQKSGNSELKMSSSGLPWWLSGEESGCHGRRAGFDPWSGEIPFAAELNSCTVTIESVPQSPKMQILSHTPQLLKPIPQQLMHHNKRGPSSEKPQESSSRLLQLEKSLNNSEDPTQPDIINKTIFLESSSLLIFSIVSYS